jgi:hypothetical protein
MVLAGAVAASGFAQEEPTPSASPDQPAPAAPSEKSLPAKPQLSAGALDVQRLAQAGVGEGVILAYVTNSATPYGLTPDGIICLKGAGVPSEVISAMITRDQQLAAAAPPLEAALAPPPSLAVTEPEEGPSIIANDDAWPEPPIVVDESDLAPEQPASLGPVRAPYPVRLNDPIVVYRLPSFALPYW